MISLCAPCQELSCPQWGHSFSFPRPSVQHWASDRSLYCSTGKVGQPDGPAGDMWRSQNSALEIDYPSLDTGEEGKKDPCARKRFELWPEVDHCWRLSKVLGTLRMIDSCYQWKDLVQREPRSKVFHDLHISPAPWQSTEPPHVYCWAAWPSSMERLIEKAKKSLVSAGTFV